MFLFHISLIGLPPVARFAAKVNLLWVLFQNCGGYWWLIGVIAVNTIVSAFYYFRVIRAMYLVENRDAQPLAANPLGTGIAVLSAAMLFVMFLGWNPLTRVTTNHARLASVHDENVAAQPHAVAEAADLSLANRPSP
jgi:NADH-quinone oxidoreductase subunit N